MAMWQGNGYASGRWVEVGRPRLRRWLEEFHRRHSIGSTAWRADVIEFVGADGEVAECHAPFGEFGDSGETAEFIPERLTGLVDEPRTVGVVLVRLGGFAVGVFDADRALVVSKVDSRLVHGRHRAGGSSSGRFARRRENQARQLVNAAAKTAQRVLGPYERQLDAVVTGGDKSAIRDVLAHDELGWLRPLVARRFLTVPDPKLAVLKASPEIFDAVRIRIYNNP